MPLRKTPDTATATVAPACDIFGDQRASIMHLSADTCAPRSRSAAEAVEPLQHADPVDHAAERHPLTRQGDGRENDEDDRPRRRSVLEHDADAEHRTERVGAGV